MVLITKMIIYLEMVMMMIEICHVHIKNKRKEKKKVVSIHISFSIYTIKNCGWFRRKKTIHAAFSKKKRGEKRKEKNKETRAE